MRRVKILSVNKKLGLERTIAWLENNWNNYDENYLTMDQIAMGCAL